MAAPVDVAYDTWTTPEAQARMWEKCDKKDITIKKCDEISFFTR
jgi:hypothetical protein